MKRRELRILGLSYSQSQIGSYIIVLSDKANRKLPIIIKPLEAQRIAIEIEGIKSPRPMIYDLLKSLSDAYGIDIQEVFIHTLAEGVFYTKIITSNGIEEAEFECTAGDAIALSVIFKCPIYTTAEIMNISSIAINDDGTPIIDENIDEEYDDNPFRVVSISDLEIMMNKALVDEEYEIAAEIRDRIKELKEKEKE